QQFVTCSTQPVRSYYTDYLERREAENKERTVEVDGWENVVSGAPSNYYGPCTEGHDLCDDAAVVDKEPTSTILQSQIALPM
ncbi:MAG: hypothetical protein JWP44_4221, partial [Mucilaginibacter sp.]|nr:hypothetical protein [Mucilaginibacter sp.]